MTLRSIPDHAFEITPEEWPEAIKRVGHVVQLGCIHQRADQKIVSHTIGLTERGLPEIFVSTKSEKTCRWMLNYLSEFLGKVTAPGMDCVEFRIFEGGFAGMLRRVPSAEATRDVMPSAGSYYGREVDALQFVLQDTRHRYPWDPGADPVWTERQRIIVDWRKNPPGKVAQVIE